MITDNRLLKYGFTKNVEVNNKITFTSFKIDYYYYLLGKNTIEVCRQDKEGYDFPQFEGMYTIRIGRQILKSSTNDWRVLELLYLALSGNELKQTK